MKYSRYWQSALAFLLLAGCADSADFPSLAKRAFEKEAVAPPPAAPAVLPSDPALLARIGDHVGQARGGQSAFDAALATARGAVSAAGNASPASDPWIAAQLQISRAERALNPARDALADLVSAQLALITQSPGSPDRAALDAAVTEVQDIANRQNDALAALKQRLRP